MKKIIVIIFAFLTLVLAAVAKDNFPQSSATAPKLPRFMSLRSDIVNARSGPGTRYPIEWVYMQKSTPVKIIAEFEDWKRISDWQGSESWIKTQMLNSKRFGMVTALGENNLFTKPNYKSKIVARIENEVVGEIIKCPFDNDFCLMKFAQFEGWFPKKKIYGLLEGETID